MLTGLFRPTPLIASCSTVTTAADGPRAIYPLTLQTEQIESDKPVGLHFSSAIYCRKQIQILRLLIPSSRHRFSSLSVAYPQPLTASLPSTFVLCSQNKYNQTKKWLAYQLSPLLPGPKQNLTLTDLVWLALPTISRSTVSTAASGSVAILLRAVQVKKIRSESSVRSHLSSGLYRQKNLMLTDRIFPEPPIICTSTSATAADFSSAF